MACLVWTCTASPGLWESCVIWKQTNQHATEAGLTESKMTPVMSSMSSGIMSHATCSMYYDEAQRCMYSAKGESELLCNALSWQSKPVLATVASPAANDGTAALRWCQADPSTRLLLDQTGICHADAIAPSLAESGWRESPSPLLDPISVNRQGVSHVTVSFKQIIMLNR